MHAATLRCKHCEQPMLLLFTSAVCDHCDGPPRGRFYRGYVVWRPERARRQGPVLDYVFRTAHEATVWRSMSDQDDCDIRCVLAPRPIEWRVGLGKASGLTMASRMVEIYPDHRFPPAANRAFFAPAGVDPGTEIAFLAA